MVRAQRSALPLEGLAEQADSRLDAARPDQLVAEDVHRGEGARIVRSQDPGPQLHGALLELLRLVERADGEVHAAHGVREVGLHLGLRLQLALDPLGAAVEYLPGRDVAALPQRVGDREQLHQELRDPLGAVALAGGPPRLLRHGDREGDQKRRAAALTATPKRCRRANFRAR